MSPDIKNIYNRVKNYLKEKFSKFFRGLKSAFTPSNIVERIKNMPRMDQVYWSKLLTGVLAGIIFGVTNFKEWPAVLVMFVIFLLISLGWFLYLRNKEPGIKVRSYFTSCIFQYFITMIAIWTLLLNLIHLPYIDY